MAVYKPSNLVPTLQEIDVLKDQVFSCQVNTSGDKVTKYKIQVLSNRGDELGSTQEESVNIKNKGTLKAPLESSFFANNSIINGKDYQWNIRTYTDKANTLVCNGFVVGSTKYVIWSKIPSPDSTTDTATKKKLQETLDNLVYDRYIQIISIQDGENKIVRGAKEDDDFVIPTESVTERLKISYVNKELGTDKDYVKIEVDDGFKYNYKDGTKYTIYQCSNEHTVNSVFADPNSEINQSDYLFIYKSVADAQAARQAGETPSSDNIDVNRLSESMIKGYDEDNKPFYRARKITGYSSDTGEIRVIDSFYTPPLDGECYRLFTYNHSSNIYEPVDEDKLETQSGNDYHLNSHIIGGLPIEDNYFVVSSNNVTSSSVDKLFIQPNINIKTDDNDDNANIITFDDNTQIKILKKTTINSETGKELDITFNKLDNTQWLLESSNMSTIRGTMSLSDLIVPQRDYEVYTNFMDSMPNSIFYARRTPSLVINVNNYTNSGTSSEEPPYEGELNPDGTTIVNYKDIEFDGELSDYFEPTIKYYQYTLYSGEEINEDNLVVKSEEIYDNDLIWRYRGLESYTDQSLLEKYTIHILIVDEYDTQFETSITFGVKYKINTGFIPLSATLECHEKAIQLRATAPLLCISTDTEEEDSVDNDDSDIEKLGDDEDYYHNYVDAKDGKVLNYTHVEIEGERHPITLPKVFTFNSQFGLTSTFVDPLMESQEEVNIENEIDELDRETDQYKECLKDLNAQYIEKNKMWKKDNKDLSKCEKTIFKLVNDDNIYELRITSLERFYKEYDAIDYSRYPFNEEIGYNEKAWENYSKDRWVNNEEAFSFKLYKNGIAVNCFENGSDGTLWDIERNTNNLFKAPHYLKYALQKYEEYRPVVSEDGVKLNNVVFIDKETFNKFDDEILRLLKSFLEDNNLKLSFYPEFTMEDLNKAPIFETQIIITTQTSNNGDVTEIIKTNIGNEIGRITVECDYEYPTDITEKYIFNEIKKIEETDEGETITNFKVVTRIKKAYTTGESKMEDENPDERYIYKNYFCEDIYWNDFYDDLYVMLDHLLQVAVNEDVPNPLDLNSNASKIVIKTKEDGEIKYYPIIEIKQSSKKQNVYIFYPNTTEDTFTVDWENVAQDYVLSGLYDNYGHVLYEEDLKDSELIWIENNETSNSYNLNYNKDEFDKVWFQIYLIDDNNGNITCKITATEGVY